MVYQFICDVKGGGYKRAMAMLDPPCATNSAHPHPLEKAISASINKAFLKSGLYINIILDNTIYICILCFSMSLSVLRKRIGIFLVCKFYEGLRFGEGERTKSCSIATD